MIVMYVRLDWQMLQLRLLKLYLKPSPLLARNFVVTMVRLRTGMLCSARIDDTTGVRIFSFASRNHVLICSEARRSDIHDGRRPCCTTLGMQAIGRHCRPRASGPHLEQQSAKLIRDHAAIATIALGKRDPVGTPHTEHLRALVVAACLL